jgi:transcriptional regulator
VEGFFILVLRQLPYLYAMYNFAYFKENDFEAVKLFMKEHPFVMLIGCDASFRPVATQVPVFFEERDGGLFLIGHIQRKTDHHQAMEQNKQVLAVFTGPHSYISASWYSNPQVASTWNYMSVHAKGTIRFLGDEELLALLKKTTAHFENDPHSPALVEKMPPEYVDKHMKAIVAFEIAVADIDNVFKLSQNRDEQSYHSIVGQLKERDADAREIANEMERRNSQLFK